MARFDIGRLNKAVQEALRQRGTLPQIKEGIVDSVRPLVGNQRVDVSIVCEHGVMVRIGERSYVVDF